MITIMTIITATITTVITTTTITTMTTTTVMTMVTASVTTIRSAYVYRGIGTTFHTNPGGKYVYPGYSAWRPGR
jgi:hypothetical protein